ncbi:MAG: hypothetical protein ACJAZN_000715 [Planctomycetota bacterium]
MPGDFTLIRAQREVLSSLDPQRSLLRLGLLITTLAALLVGYLALTGRHPFLELVGVGALVAPLGIGEWYFERHPVFISRWIHRAFLGVCFTALAVAVARKEFLWVIVALSGLFPFTTEFDRPLERKIEEYQSAGGKMSDLFQTARREDRRFFSPAGAVIIALITVFAVVMIWSYVEASLAGSSRSGVIGIG